MNYHKSLIAVTLVLFFLAELTLFVQCSNKETQDMKIEKREFGKMSNGDIVHLYTLTNMNGMKVEITNYGGIISSIIVPDKNGNMGEVALGYDHFDDYLKNNFFFGCVVGRYGNRIAKGKFTLDGEEYSLAINNGTNHLHGGLVGFNQILWEVKQEITESDKIGIVLHYLSQDMEEGYPGNLDVTMTYTLTNDNEIFLDYKATTDKKTICNLTNHSYFNLKDGGASDMLDHEMWIDADQIVPTDETSIPLGDLMGVKGTPFDFTSPKKIGAQINDNHVQIRYGQGYDHNFVINNVSGDLKKIAKVTEASSGRMLEVFTKEPGVQFYSGNFITERTGKNSVVYNKRHGFCLETQHYPDSPNQSSFPSTVLEPGEAYQTTTVYKFSIQ